MTAGAVRVNAYLQPGRPQRRGHAPVFVVEVRVGPEINARGGGHSKRAAQQAAAHAALQLMDVEEGYEEPVDDYTEEPDHTKRD